MKKNKDQAPPPPPPLGTAAPPPSSRAVPPPPHPAPLPHMLALQPPPLPPLPTTLIAPVQMAPPVYLDANPFGNTTTFSVLQPPPSILPMFDVSRPPPSLPPNAIRNERGAVKRAADYSEAGPSKARKPEDYHVVNCPCENCIERVFRIEQDCQELEKLECEKEYHSYVLKKKIDEYEHNISILKSSVSPDLFRELEKYIEGPSQLAQGSRLEETSSSHSGTSTVPKQFLHQLIENVYQQNVLDSARASSDFVERLNSLVALDRRQDAVSHTSDTVAIHTLLEVLRHSTTLSNNQVNESVTYGRPSTPNRNINRFNSGASTEAASSSSRYPTTNVVVRTHPSAAASTAAHPPAAPHPPASHLVVPHIPSASHPPGALYPPVHPPMTGHPLNAVHPAVAGYPSTAAYSHIESYLPYATHLPTAAHPATAAPSTSTRHPPTMRSVAVPPSYMLYQPGLPPPPSDSYYSQTYPSTSNHVPNMNSPYTNSPVQMEHRVSSQAPPPYTNSHVQMEHRFSSQAPLPYTNSPVQMEHRVSSQAPPPYTNSPVQVEHRVSSQAPPQTATTSSVVAPSEQYTYDDNNPYATGRYHPPHNYYHPYEKH